MNYLWGKDDWKKFEKNNPTVALSVLYVKKMNIYIMPKFQTTAQIM